MLPCFPVPVWFITLSKMCLFHGSHPELGPSLLSLPRTQPLPAPPTGLLYTHAEWSPRADSLAPHSSAHRYPAIPLSPCYTICPGSSLG